MRLASRHLASWRLALAVLFGLALSGTAAAKPTRFWNLTENTITKLELAPAGTEQWGADQAKNDKDGTIEFDERVKIVGVKPGKYDARLEDAKGRKCIVKNLDVKEGDVFSIEEKQLANTCSK